jgi:hypothetical protein
MVEQQRPVLQVEAGLKMEGSHLFYDYSNVTLNDTVLLMGFGSSI